MRKKFSLFLFLLIISNDIVYGKHRNRTKAKSGLKHGSIASKITNNRLKRSLVVDVEQKGNPEERKYYSGPKLDKEPPFWATRGKRDSSEDVEDIPPKYLNNEESQKFKILNYNLKRDDEDSPFWGNRGRRNSDKSEEILYNSDKSIYRERRQDDDPFWGTRGRREFTDDNRGRLGNYISDTNDPPFWGNRGRREESEPFWGNRGRRQENEPFWANRGRREAEAVIDSRGKKKLRSRMILNDDMKPFWGNRGRRRLKIKNSILKAIYDVRDSIDDLIEQTSEGNKNMLPKAFNNRIVYPQKKLGIMAGNEQVAKKSDQKTVLDDRMYAEEPHYITVERSSRSSGEFDPFYISRGKKFSNLEITKSIPNRRGSLEDFVKSVRNDPYYIARGKKDNDSIGNTTSSDIEVTDKNVFCMLVEQLLNKNKVKREVTERSDRDRRTILKNLALKLQMDPYYVSRGKKDSDESIFGSKENFIERYLAKCNEN